MTNTKKGIYLALATALVSGVAVFLSKFATAAVGDSNVFTTAKNIVVALILSLLILTPALWTKLKSLKKGDWIRLAAIGIVGGSIPFLLFFKGLSMSGSVNSAFIHKTLFIWVMLLAIPFLKEKFSRIQLAAFGLLVVGNFLLVGIKSWSFGSADLMILGATLLWAVEYIIAKKVLVRIESKIVAWSRMFFGSIILIGFVLFIGKGAALVSMNTTQWAWIGLISVFLLGYVLTWYEALKLLPASIVTSVLVIASPITTLLNTIFVQHKFSLNQVFGSLIIAVSVGLIYYGFVKFQAQEKLEQVALKN